jgi:hypothetical protein
VWLVVSGGIPIDLVESLLGAAIPHANTPSGTLPYAIGSDYSDENRSGIPKRHPQVFRCRLAACVWWFLLTPNGAAIVEPP